MYKLSAEGMIRIRTLKRWRESRLLPMPFKRPIDRPPKMVEFLYDQIRLPADPLRLPADPLMVDDVASNIVEW